MSRRENRLSKQPLFKIGQGRRAKERTVDPEAHLESWPIDLVEVLATLEVCREPIDCLC